MPHEERGNRPKDKLGRQGLHRTGGRRAVKMVRIVHGPSRSSVGSTTGDKDTKSKKERKEKTFHNSPLQVRGNEAGSLWDHIDMKGSSQTRPGSFLCRGGRSIGHLPHSANRIARVAAKGATFNKVTLRGWCRGFNSLGVTIIRR